MKQTKFQLKNKLNVLLIESRKSPVISVQMWVKTGSADEKKSEEGISHFIEHLVFKGTEKYNVGDIANLVEASGGELNAYTSFDQTVFYVTISKNFKDVALDVVSQMMGYPTFDPAEIDSEREVVCEEIKMGQDSPRRRSSQLMFSNTFRKHAYGIPVIGYEKNVRSWPAKKIKDYYKSRYIPSNMFLVVSGDFDSAEMKKQVQNYFGGFKNYRLKKVKRTKEPVQKKPQLKALSYPQQDQHLHLVFKAPSIKHRDVPGLDVLTMILGQGDSSRLVKKLRLEKPLVSSTSAMSYNPVDQGLIAISSYFQGSHFEEICRISLEEIRKLQTEEVSWQEIKKAVVAISSEQFYSIETVEGLANKAGTLEFYFKDQKAQEKYLRQVNQVTPKQIQSLAKKYFKLQTLSAAYMGPQKENELNSELKKVESIWAEVFSKKTKNQLKKQKKTNWPKLTMKKIVRSQKLEVEELLLDSGIKVLFAPSTEIPTVSAKLVFRGGARLEQPDVMGLAELSSRLWVSSTQNRTEESLNYEIEESAIGLSAFSGKNTSGYSLEYLSAFETKALELLKDCALNTKFEDAIIEREKEMLKQAIKSREDHPSSLCMRQFSKAIFGHHPLSFEATGTFESLARIQREHLIGFKDSVLSPKNLTVCVVGDYNKALWLKTLKDLGSKLKTAATATPIHKLESFNENKKVFLKSDKEQSHVIVGWRGLTINSNKRHILEAIDAILSGQGGRLFYELRDKNSLAYSVSPLKMESLETGYFGGYIACSPDKVDKAIQMFYAEFDKLVKEPVSDLELDRAKKYLIGQHDIGLQKKSALCNLIIFDDIYGNDYRKSLDVADDYNSITKEEIQSLAKELFTRPSVISIVGRDGLEKSEMKKSDRGESTLAST